MAVTLLVVTVAVGLLAMMVVLGAGRQHRRRTPPALFYPSEDETRNAREQRERLP